MTVEKFYEVLSLVLDLESEFHLQRSLEAINLSLASLVLAPATPTHQSALAAAKSEFTISTDQVMKLLTPAQRQAISEIGGSDFFDESMAFKVQESIAANAMTPSVAKEFVNAFVRKRADFLEIAKQTTSNLQAFGVKGYELAPGTADLSFVVPMDLFGGQLGLLAKELTFFEKLLRDCSEALTGEVEIVRLEKLSSSVPTVAVLASLPVIAALAEIVNRFLDAWKKVEEIRQMRTKLQEMGLKGKALEELSDQVTTIIDEIVEESTEVTLANYPGDKNRANEIRTALTQDVQRLYGQIERGLVLDFHAESKKNAPSNDLILIASIQEAARNLQFPAPSSTPLLLINGEVLEGLVISKQTVRRSKKTTTSEKHQAGGPHPVPRT